MMSPPAAAAIVRSAYREILEREPDVEGGGAFIDALCSGALTPAGLISDLFHSPERQAKSPTGPQPADRQASEGRIGERKHDPASGTALTAPVERPVEAPAARQASPSAGAGELPLDGAYSATPSAWDRFLGPLFDRTLHSAPPRRRAFDRLRLVLEVADPDADRFARSLHALGGVVSAADFPVGISVVWRGGGALPGDLARLLDASGASADVCTSRRQAQGGWGDDDLVLWLQSGDAPRPELSPALAAHVEPGTKVASWDGYFSEGGRIHPVLHPGPNPTLVMNVDSLFSRFACRAEVLQGVGLAADEDPIALLRGWLRARSARELWTHIPLPLLQLEIDRGEITRRREVAIAQAGPCRTERIGRDLSAARVSLVICTKDKGHLLRQLVEGVSRLQADRLADIVIVSNNTTNLYAKQTLDDLRKLPKVRIVEYNQRFNFSAQSNLGARESTGDYVLMLNDDIAPITSDWLDRLLEPFADPAVGVVGPLLLYPDERVQHAGMFMGFQGSAGHALRFSHLPERDYMFYASAPREVGVVTGAVMLISRPCFEALNGFDELLATYLQDVDLCLRAVRSGFRIVFTPASRLIHMESASVSAYIADHAVNENRGREHAYFARRWGPALDRDAFHNPMFSNADESLRRLTAAP